MAETLIPVPGKFVGVEYGTPLLDSGEIRDNVSNRDLNKTIADIQGDVQLTKKAYVPEDYSGLGRVYLEKNLVDSSMYFSRFIETAQGIEPSALFGAPDEIVYETVYNRFLGVKTDATSTKYYTDWQSTTAGIYINPDADHVYACEDTGKIYTYSNGTLIETTNASKNILTQDMVNKANTIYVVQYDYYIVDKITESQATSSTVIDDKYYAYKPITVADNSNYRAIDGCVIIDYQHGSVIGKNLNTGYAASQDYAIAREGSSLNVELSYYKPNGTITMPEGCVLQFEGGSINYGSIVYNKTRLSGDVKMYARFSSSNTLVDGGYLVNGEIYASWFGVVGDASTDDSDALQRAINHLNNNMITLYIDRCGILLTKTITIRPMANNKPYKIIGSTKNDTVFWVQSDNFTGSVVFDINNFDGSCVLSNLLIVFDRESTLPTEPYLRTINGFKFTRIRNSVFESLSTYRANIGLEIISASYGIFDGCRFDDGNIGVLFNGTFNSEVYTGLHCGGNKQYGIQSMSGVSPTNIVMYSPVLENNYCHVKLQSGIFILDHPYIGDASQKCVENLGADLTINGIGNGEGISGAGTSQYRPDNCQAEISEIILNGGATHLNDILVCDQDSPVATNYIKNSNCIRHISGLLYLNNVRVSKRELSNNLIKIDNETLIRYAQKAENFALDGSRFMMGINYNLFKTDVPAFLHNNAIDITAEPTITFIPKTNGVGNVMRLTLPVCTAMRYGLVVPLRFPSYMIGQYCMVSIKYKYNASETNAQMVANGHSGIIDAALLTKNFHSTDYWNSGGLLDSLKQANLKPKNICSCAYYGWIVPFNNNSEDGSINNICTVEGQITTYCFPIKVSAVEDYLVLLFSTLNTVTFTSDLVLDILQIAAVDSNYSDVLTELIDTKEIFALPTTQRPTFANPSNADGFTIYDTTINKPIRFDGVSGWRDNNGSIV